MADIREFTRDDAKQVAALQTIVARSAEQAPPAGLAEYFERTFLDHPWADPEIPSLVYESDGEILGFIGAHVRRLLVDGEPRRGVYGGQFVTHPDARAGLAGALLLRRFLAGPQDLTLTDGATAVVRHMWERCGGRTIDLHSLGWMRVLRPWDPAARRLGDIRYGGPLATALGPAARLLDRATTKVPPLSLAPSPAGQKSRALEIDDLLDPPRVFRQRRITVDYDHEFLTWIFREMAAVESRGPLERRMVLTEEGRPAGWWIAYFPKGRLAQVVNLTATPSTVDLVVDHLLAEASQAGVSAVHGRLESPLFEALATRRCLIRPTTRVLVHSPDPALAEAAAAGNSTLSRMDGEWWMGHYRLFG